MRNAQAARIGILAFGSLRDSPGEEITAATNDRRKVETPFPVEFARYSGKTRGGAPTLVPVEAGGTPVAAELLILDDDVSLERAKDMLWRRETGTRDKQKRYKHRENPGRDHVLVKELPGFAGASMVIYTDFASEGKDPGADPTDLASRAVKSLSMAENDWDGITYLIKAKRSGVMTPKTVAYEREILKITGATTLEEALARVRDR